MRTPQDVRWDREVVYECTWTLLNAIDNHNLGCAEDERISKVVCPGLATGVGRVSAQRCAEQMALALMHYEDAVNNPKLWSALEWKDINETAEDLFDTYKM